MQIQDWILKAGQYTPLQVSGRFLRLKNCTGTIQIDVDYESPETDRITSKMIVGLGVDLSHPISHARFKTIAFTSPVDQVVTVIVSEFPTVDSTLSGSVSVPDTDLTTAQNGNAFSLQIGSNTVLQSTYFPIAEIQNLSATQSIVIDELRLISMSNNSGYFDLGVFSAAALNANGVAGYIRKGNLLAGAAASGIIQAFYNSVTTWAMASNVQRCLHNPISGNDQIFIFKNPIVIAPNGRLSMGWAVVQDVFEANFKGRII